MSNPAQVFQTNNPARWKRIKWTGRIIFFILVFLMAVLVLAIVNGSNPSLPNMNNKAKYYQSKLDPSNKLTFSSPLNKRFKGFKDFLETKQREDSVKKISNKRIKAPQIRAAFYTPWLSASLSDLQKNGDKLNTIYPIEGVGKSLAACIDFLLIADNKE